MGNLVSEIERPGLVPNEHHHRDFPGPLRAAPRCINHKQIHFVVCGLLELRLRVQQFDGLQLDRELRLLLQRLQLLFDAGGLLSGGFVCLDAPVAAPRRFLSASFDVVHKDRLHAKWFAREKKISRDGFGRRRERACWASAQAKGAQAAAPPAVPMKVRRLTPPVPTAWHGQVCADERCR